MRGHVHERRPGIWLVRVDGGPDPVSGKRRQPSRTIRGNRQEAELGLAQLMVDVGNGVVPMGTSATVAQLLERWFDHAATRLSPTTLRGYRKLATQRILPRFGPRPLDSVTTAELDYFYDGLTALGLSAQTVRNVHSVIRRAYAHAVRWGWTTVNPATNAAPPSVTREQRESLTAEELSKAMIVAEEMDAEFAVFLRLAIGTGARRGELCALRWTDLNLELRQVRIRRSIACVDDGWVEKVTKTRAERTVMLDFGTADTLKEHRVKMLARAAEGLVDLAPDAFLFSARLDCSRPWHPDSATGWWSDVRSKAGLPEWARLHDVRHAHASLLIDAGLPITTVSERMGHASGSAVTLTIYGHAFKRRDSEAAAVIGTLLDKGESNGQ